MNLDDWKKNVILIPENIPALVDILVKKNPCV